MPRNCEFDQRTLGRLMGGQHNVIARGQALDCGMSEKAVRFRLRDGGPWQRLLPGVYLTHTGSPSPDEREMGALLYAGPQAVLTGGAALRRFGLAGPRADAVDVLVPADRQKCDTGFARLHRTRRLPELICSAGEVRYVLPPRAVADAVRELADIQAVRAVVAEAVQEGRCPIALLVDELAKGPKQGSALLRQALAEVADGVRSSAEADLRTMIKRGRLPMPLFNPSLFVGRTFLASPDCWWPDAGVAAEVDSRAWHLSPRGWENTLARHARMSSRGIIVLHFTPGQISAQRKEVLLAIRHALASGRARPLPHIRTVPAS